MMPRAVRGRLTGLGGSSARPTGQARPVLLILAALGLALGLAGCVGGQSGSEGLCGESDGKRDINTFTTESTDEDGGVDDGGAEINFVGDDGPEAQSDAVQCLSGEED
jgi:hypothetical protein